MNVVCFVLVTRDKDLLMEKRLKPDFQMGKWAFPWASVEEGENPDETATRILSEQLNLKGTKPRLKSVLHLTSGFPWKQENNAQDYVFAYEEVSAGEASPSNEISETKYRDPYDVIKDPDLHHFHRDIAQALGIGWKPLGIENRL
jgi:ADP-ribose pyrophosphatase YjhB (NUDIX family)|tara:strand:+ start:438 stop:872 length:435 start_codon:yes stop_codon:yes gene_type:complete